MRRFFTPGGFELMPLKPRIRKVDPVAVLAQSGYAITHDDLERLGLTWRCQVKNGLGVGFGPTPLEAFKTWEALQRRD